jgi:hypothetical protein
MGMRSRRIFYLIFTPFVAKVTVHGPPLVETSSFAVKDVGVSSTMLKRHFPDSPHCASSSGHTQVFPLTVPQYLYRRGSVLSAGSVSSHRLPTFKQSPTTDACITN